MKNFITALIEELASVYSKLVLSVLRIRSERYRQQSQGMSAKSQDIHRPLSNAITTISQHARKTAATSTDSSTNTRRQLNVQPPSASRNKQGDFVESALSKYFKDTAKGTEAYPGIEERLVTSVWDHVHAAVRAARNDDETTAQMHVLIASNACHELARYLPEAAYLELVTDIENHLDKKCQELT